MKTSLLLFFAVVASVSAEAPRFRNGNQRGRFFARQEAEPTAPEAQGGPYAPSGWKPAGERLRLPARQEALPPVNEYGAPDNAYGVPTNEYGAPLITEPGVEPEAEILDDQPAKLRIRNQKIVTQPQNNVYYIQQQPQAQQQRLVVGSQAVLPQVQYYQGFQAPFVASPLYYTSPYVQVV